MHYKPHRLYKKSFVEERDEYNRIIQSGDALAFVCMCRCDDNTDKRFASTEGEMYMPKYHIVAEGKVDISAGDHVVVMDGDEIRGEGEVYSHKHLNKLRYTDIWV